MIYYRNFLVDLLQDYWHVMVNGKEYRRFPPTQTLASGVSLNRDREERYKIPLCGWRHATMNIRNGTITFIVVPLVPDWAPIAGSLIYGVSSTTLNRADAKVFFERC